MFRKRHCKIVVLFQKLVVALIITKLVADVYFLTSLFKTSPFLVDKQDENLREEKANMTSQIVISRLYIY